MTTLNLVDLNVSQALDNKAMAELRGGARDHLSSVYVATGSWSGYSLMSKSYIGQTFHDGYLTKHYYEGWKRTRTQTEYSYWNRYYRV